MPDERFQVLAELAVHGANIQPGQVVGVAAELGHAELARAIAAAAYARGALYVDVNYFDPWVKRERILQWQAQQEFPICPTPDDPQACNVYRELRFPDSVYEQIGEYWEEKAEAQDSA